MIKGESHTWWLWRRATEDGRRRELSPIVLRILAVNVMALAILVGSLLYLGRYQDKIIATELEALTLQSRIIASAVAEDAIVVSADDRSLLSPLLARSMIRRLAETAETRTRLFDSDNNLMADSRMLPGGKNKVQIEALAPTDERPTWLERIVSNLFDVMDLIHERQEYPLYSEREVQRGDHYTLVKRALQGDTATQIWRAQKGGLVLAAAVPVQHYKHVLGVVMLSRSDVAIDKAITSVRINILKIFFVTLFITTLLSLYLARAIAKPIRLLAQAAEGLRTGQMRIMGLAGTARLLNNDAIPDMTDRNDEIGDLSGALRELTAALGQRIGAIENFAADVAHEIKNPLTSLRSAIETLGLVRDPSQQEKLLLVIRDDVDRLDRLITDIAHASRLDAELSRAEASAVDIGQMLITLVHYYHEVTPVLLEEPTPNLIVHGAEIRLVQVVQNLINNALSFSPPGGSVILRAQRDHRTAVISVDDNGTGIPDNKLEAIFDRFYSERPKTEKFGTHSGLGLSISKQIVEAHRGSIHAENRRDEKGNIVGARFTVRLPLASDAKTV